MAIYQVAIRSENGVSVFQKTINSNFDGVECIAVGIDDVVISGSTEAEHTKTQPKSYCAKN